jgi:hypothetical protein
MGIAPLAVAGLALAFAFGLIIFLMYYIGGGMRRHLVLAVICGAVMIGAVVLAGRPLL